jgi:two-component system cell cycle sensor histidine kinase/response regulator CckA
MTVMPESVNYCLATLQSEVDANDFQKIFESAPGLFLVLSPSLHIVAVSDQYLRATMTSREVILGQDLFDVFPDNPTDIAATGTRNLHDSLVRVLETGEPDVMAVQKYDIRRPEAEGGEFEERYWSPINSPVLGPDGEVRFIIHRVEDVTAFVRLKQQGDQERNTTDELRNHVSRMETEIYLRAQEIQDANEELRQANESLTGQIRQRELAEAKVKELALELRVLNQALAERVLRQSSELVDTQRALSQEVHQRHFAQEKFELAVESAPNAIVMIDQTGRIILVNEQTELLFEYNRSELLGQSVEVLVPERYRKQHPGQVAGFFADPSSRPMGGGRDLFGRRKDGSEFPVEIGLNPIRTAEGMFVLSSIVDITERKRAEEVQRRNDLRFRGIFDQTFAMMGLLSTDGTIMDVNRSALDFRGLASEEVVGKPLWKAPWFDISIEMQNGIRRVIERAATGEFVRQEVTLNDGQGGLRAFDFTIKPVINGAGVVELLIPEAHDITERKKLEEQYRHAQKMEAVGKLAGGVAHDFNNMLTVILGYSDIIKQVLRADDPIHEYIEQVELAGNRAAELTRQLLAFSRKQVLTPVVLNLNDQLSEMETMLTRLIGEDVVLAIRPTEDLWRVKVDAGQIGQVLMNLAVNSRDAMPQGGKLTIETSNVELDEHYASNNADARSGEYVLLAVSDTGCGMDRATLAQIFEPFFSTKGDMGTGLGLATVYGIVKQSNGHIAAYSEPGIGTTFKVYLPREHDGQVQPRQLVETNSKRGTETVLLVEDEDGVRLLARLTLQRHGYHVLEARHGGEALLFCEQHEGDIHLLATDVVMPQMSGRELADRLRILRPSMKVLYMSGYMDDAIVRHGLLDAGVPFLQKPYTPHVLADKVRTVLDTE